MPRVLSLWLLCATLACATGAIAGESTMPSDAEIDAMADSLLDLGLARHGAEFGDRVLDGTAEELKGDVLESLVPALEQGGDGVAEYLLDTLPTSDDLLEDGRRRRRVVKRRRVIRRRRIVRRKRRSPRRSSPRRPLAGALAEMFVSLGDTTFARCHAARGKTALLSVGNEEETDGDFDQETDGGEDGDGDAEAGEGVTEPATYTEDAEGDEDDGNDDDSDDNGGDLLVSDASITAPVEGDDHLAQLELAELGGEADTLASAGRRYRYRRTIRRRRSTIRRKGRRGRKTVRGKGWRRSRRRSSRRRRTTRSVRGKGARRRRRTTRSFRGKGARRAGRGRGKSVCATFALGRLRSKFPGDRAFARCLSRALGGGGSMLETDEGSEDADLLVSQSKGWKRTVRYRSRPRPRPRPRRVRLVIKSKGWRRRRPAPVRRRPTTVRSKGWRRKATPKRRRPAPKRRPAPRRRRPKTRRRNNNLKANRARGRAMASRVRKCIADAQRRGRKRPRRRAPKRRRRKSAPKPRSRRRRSAPKRDNTDRITSNHKSSHTSTSNVHVHIRNANLGGIRDLVRDEIRNVLRTFYAARLASRRGGAVAPLPWSRKGATKRAGVDPYDPHTF